MDGSVFDWHSPGRTLMRRLWTGALCGLVSALAACDDGPASKTRYMHPAGTWDFMVDATQTGPLLIDIEGQALPGSNVEFEGTVIALMNEAEHKRIIRFTPDPAVAPSPDYRVVVAFNMNTGLDDAALCSGEAQGGAPNRERIETLATFCHGQEVLSSVQGWMGQSASSENGEFRKLIQQVTRELFAQAP